MAKQRDIIICCDCEGTPEQLSRLFRSIQNAGVPANFFFVGETVKEQPELVREIAAIHQSESHTEQHPHLRKLPKEEQREAIMTGRRGVEECIGRPTRGFRAPYHALNRDTVAILNEEGFVFDASNLYYRYNMGGVHELRPTWFREWMPLYESLRLKPHTAFGIFRQLVRLNEITVLPAHPHYAGADEPLADAFEGFMKWGLDYGATFWAIDEWLHERLGVARPDWMPEQTRASAN
jgi:peptidoglycan/xylan/chitin deacetylase (PgdA/CDA1 family)